MENEAKFCDNCNRRITVNADLHIIHCKKNLQLCIVCQEPVRINEKEEHLQLMHVIEVCDFCKRPFERWKLEEHKNDCSKKPLLCKFCNLDVAADDFKEHAEVCWSRTEKCSSCAQYVQLRDMEFHDKACKNPSMMGYADCQFCKEHFPVHVIDTHESACGEKTTRCPDCGHLIKKYKNYHTCEAKKNSSVSALSGKANGQDQNREVYSRPPFNHANPLSNSYPIEPAKNQAVELSPPVQRDLSDRKFKRILKDGNISIPTQCKLCLECLIPQESRIHPEICPMRPSLCKFCQNKVPHNILQPDLHHCQYFMPTGTFHISGTSAMDEPSSQGKYTPEYSSQSNLSKEYPKIHTQDCPLCSKTFPADRFNDHVRACAQGKMHCYLCKKDYYGGGKEHMEKCSKKGRGSNKGAKQKANKEEKNEGFFTRGWNMITSGQKKEKTGNRPISNLSSEKQLVVDGIPCEFCNEIYPFAEIAVHELGCLHEMSQAEKRMKEAVSMKKPEYEVPQASGYTPYDPSQYMITDPHENKDKPRNKRFTEKSSEDVSSKFSYSEPNQGSGKSHNYQSEAYYNNFYEKHLVKDHEKDKSAGKSHREPRKAFKEEKKKDIIFVYSSEAKNKFPVQEKRLEQGARPKNLGEFPSKNYSSHKGLNCLSDSDEETDLHQNKVEDVNLENNKGFSSIGSERKQKKSSIESKNNYRCISNENGRNPKSSSQDVSSCVTNKKGSFNSDTSEDVYLSCDEGEENPEGRSFNKDAKVKNEERDDKKIEKCSTDVRRPSNQEDILQKHDIIGMSDFDKYLKRNKDANIERDDRNNITEKRSLFSMQDRLKKHGISMDDIDKYLMRDKDAKILKDEEKDGRDCNTEMISLSSKDRLKKQGIGMNDFDQYLKGDQNYNHHLKPIDSITSKSSIILSDKEEHSLLHKYVMDIDDLEREEDKKNEETFASESQIDMNPFEAMSNSQYSYETVSSWPPYSSVDLDSTNHGAVDIKSDENLDAYLQFLGLDDPEPDANYRLFGSTHGTKVLEPDSSYGYLENVQLGANNTNDHVPQPTSVPQEPSVQTEELKGVSKNMPSYTSPFLLGNECEERELGISTQRSFPVSLQEEKIREISDESRIVVDLQSQEEKDNELNSKMWGTWRSPRQIDSDE